MSHPLTGRLDVSQRVKWMRQLLGDWAHVGSAFGPRLIVAPKAGVQRPPW